jgi:hypothetical protein
MRFVDRHQISFFKSPNDTEDYFSQLRGDDISATYLTDLNAFLQKYYTFCANYKSTDDTNDLGECSDVLTIYVRIYTNPMTNKLAIVFKYINTRPCFAGNSMLTVMTFLLLRAACARDDVESVVVDKCVDATVKILERKFGDLMEKRKHRKNDGRFVDLERYFSDEYYDTDIEPVDYSGYKSDFGSEIKSVGTEPSEEEPPDCVFTDFARIRQKVTVEGLGLADKISMTQDGKLTLKQAAFPTADQLNDPVWVDTNTRIYVDPSLLLADKEMEGLFVENRGESISNNYIVDQINPMLNSMCEDLKTGDDEEFTYCTDVMCMTVCVHRDCFEDDAGYDIIVEPIQERPCFAGHNMTTLLLLQLLKIAWKRGDIIKICLRGVEELESRVIKQKFENATVFNANDRYHCLVYITHYRDASSVQRLVDTMSSKIKSNTADLIQLKKDGFPTASELNNILRIVSDPTVLHACIDTNIERYEDLLFRN